MNRKKHNAIPPWTSVLLAAWLLRVFPTSWALVQPNSQPNGNMKNSGNEAVYDQYAQHWDDLLMEEHKEAIRQIRDQRSKWSPQRLENNGLAILEAFAEAESEILGEKTVRIVATNTMRSSAPQKRPWQDLFGKGDILEMTALGQAGSSFSSHKRQKSLSFHPRECLIMELGDDWMVVGTGPTWPAGMWEARRGRGGSMMVRLDKQMGSTAPLQAQRQSLLQLRTLPSSFVGSSVHLLAKIWGTKTTTAIDMTSQSISANGMDPEGQASQIPGYLRFSNDSPESTLQQYLQESLDRAVQKHEHYASTRPSSDEAATWTANESQRHAIVWALQRKLSLVRGPPGTGKTRTAALLISTALELNKFRKLKKTKQSQLFPTQQQSIRVLAVTHSNGAADVLLEALLELGVPAVRAGRPASMSPKVQHRSVIALAEKLQHIKEFRKELIQKSNKASSFSGSSADDGAGMQWQLKKSLEDAQSMLLQSAPVVVTSCIGAHQLAGLQQNDGSGSLFPLVVLDEAAQCTEPALVCALTAAQAQQVVLLGDPQQLPPTVTSSSKHLRQSLGVSPMERLEAIGVQQQTLRVQYRMPPSLLEHPSKYFYNNLVQSVETIVEESVHQYPPKGFDWPNPQYPLAFVHVGNGDSEVVHTMGGRSNPTEASAVSEIVSDLLKQGTNATNIAILTPYSKQAQAIRLSLVSQSLRIGRNVTAQTETVLKNWQSTRSNTIRDVKVGTVDSFQGQETDIVVFSTVRSNTFSELGFLRDRRRLCVAITRARKGLIVLGDPTTLSSCQHWQALIQSCRERGCFVEKKVTNNTRTVENKTNATEDDEGSGDAGAISAEAILNHSDSLYGLFSGTNSTCISDFL